MAILKNCINCLQNIERYFFITLNKFECAAIEIRTRSFWLLLAGGELYCHPSTPIKKNLRYIQRNNCSVDGSHLRNLFPENGTFPSHRCLCIFFTGSFRFLAFSIQLITSVSLSWPTHTKGFSFGFFDGVILLFIVRPLHANFRWLCDISSMYIVYERVEEKSVLILCDLLIRWRRTRTSPHTFDIRSMFTYSTSSFNFFSHAINYHCYYYLWLQTQHVFQQLFGCVWTQPYSSFISCVWYIILGVRLSPSWVYVCVFGVLPCALLNFNFGKSLISEQV